VTTEPKQASEAKRAVKGIGWLSLGRIAGMVLSFVSTAILARMLNPSDFGVMATSLIVIALATAIFDGTFAIGLIQRKEIDGDYVSSAFWLSLLLAGAIVLIVCLIAPFLAGFFKIKDYSAIFSISSLALLFKAIENISVAYLRREGRFGAIAGYQFWASFLGYVPVTIFLAWRGLGPWALVWGQLAVAAFLGLSSFALARLPLRFAVTRKATHDIFATSGHFTLSQILNWAALTGSNSVVGHSFGPQALGFYSRAWKLLDIVTGVTAGPLQGVLIPTFARMQDDKVRARQALERALSTSILFFGVLSAFCVAHAGAMVAIALGPKWTDCVPITQILFAVLVPRCCYKISESATVGFGHSKSVAIRQGLYAALMIGGAFAGVPFGPVWVAVGASVAVTVFYLSSVAYAAHLVGMERSFLLFLHGRGIVFSLAVFLLDSAVMRATAGLGFWPSQILGGATSALLLGGVLIAVPEKWIGRDIINLRELAMKKLTRRPAVGKG
jgi:PST family polysaccharide transporter